MVRNNIKYELMNVLYNLAALYSQLAVNSPRGNAKGLKLAAHNFNLAAGVLSHMQKEVLPELRMSDPPEDMDDHTLEALVQLFLAQSQECSWQSGVMNGLKDLSIAKLAAQVSDLYNSAAEAAMKSEAISSAWIHHMTAKHHHFAAAAQYRAARDCLEKRRYGEEVARLKDAVACLTEGVKETRGGYLNKIVVDDLNALKRKAEDDLKRAEKDNDMIFLSMSAASVPVVRELTGQIPCRPNRSSRSWTGSTCRKQRCRRRWRTRTSFSATRRSLGRRSFRGWSRSLCMWPSPSTKSGVTGW